MFIFYTILTVGNFIVLMVNIIKKWKEPMDLETATLIILTTVFMTGATIIKKIEDTDE